MMRILKELKDGLTLRELVKIAEDNNISLDTKISIMGSETRYVMEQNGYILLDEINLEEM